MRAVDRVQVPADAGVRVARPELLADDAVIRERVGDPCPQLLLDPAVGLGDERPVGLRLDDEVAAERPERDRVGRVAQVEGESEPAVQLGLVATAERGRPFGAEVSVQWHVPLPWSVNDPPGTGMNSQS